ncbi:endoplasmic reticulum-Golgi intermediate compartment protein 3-like [Canna indica]|uniref:Endoplasmic reticulum-Golgi intermediate compartment protein 3-like n=1 Tax=Canna indica TaxID=4628 RepID=A0AAQ3QFW4_9LILI|nr:endoplasmic reticulum-Golgi intermediate compartment protein 3-like [Canna indica]
MLLRIGMNAATLVKKSMKPIERKADPDLIDQCKRKGFLQRIRNDGEGCNIYGFLDVKKVAGNSHFDPGKSFQQSNMHVHDLLPFQKESFNVIYMTLKILNKVMLT